MADRLKRISTSTRATLAFFMLTPIEEQYGLDIADQLGMKPGTLYPILARLENHGWLTSRWEDIDPFDVGRPRRRYYRLTDGGIDLAREALASAPPALARWAFGGAE